MDSTTIWYTNPVSFITNQTTMLEIIPDRSMSLNRQLNAAMRFAIYFSIVLLVIKKDARVLFFAVFVGFVTWAMHAQSAKEDESKRELFEKLQLLNDVKGRACTKPTKNNPFMNVMPADYTSFPNRPKACNIEDPSIKKDVNDKFEDGLFRQEHDVFFKTASDRQFFTNPCTTIPNDQKGFAEWLYKVGPTRKEKGITAANYSLDK
jgi:hypothetical protein